MSDTPEIKFDPKATIRKAYMIINDPGRRAFIAMLNNRIVPNSTTIMLPGCIVENGKPVATLALHVAKTIGVTIDEQRSVRHVKQKRFIDQAGDLVILDFYMVDMANAVPYNNLADQGVMSVSWLSPTDVERMTTNEEGMLAQLGVKDALDTAFDIDYEKNTNAKGVIDLDQREDEAERIILGGRIGKIPY